MKLGDPQWANYPAAAAWMMLHVWDHFDFTGDVQWFQRQGWPLLKVISFPSSQSQWFIFLQGVAEFWLDNLFEDVASGDGTLVTIPCDSPENPLVGPTFGAHQSSQIVSFSEFVRSLQLARTSSSWCGSTSSCDRHGRVLVLICFKIIPQH